MRIYTRTGDAGETALLGGVRVAKHHRRIAAYGTVDELNATLGVARAAQLPESVDAVVERLQHELFAVGTELATPEADGPRPEWLTEAHVEQLEADIDRFEASLTPLDCFILPAGTPSTAALHVARCVCRRAERELSALAAADPIRPLPLMYLNRAGDLLFVLARAASHAAGAAETPWRKP